MLLVRIGVQLILRGVAEWALEYSLLRVSVLIAPCSLSSRGVSISSRYFCTVELGRVRERGCRDLLLG